MTASLNEDILAHLVDLLYYDEQQGRPDHRTLARLCLVNRTVRHIAQKLLYMWIYLPTDRAARVFLTSCARRPLLGQAVHVVQLDLLTKPNYGLQMTGVLPKRFPSVLYCCPNVRLLIVNAPAMLPAVVMYDVAATPAARQLRALHLSSYRNDVVHQLLGAFPLVDRLNLELEHVDTEYRMLPSGWPFREVCVTIHWGTPPYVCAAFMLPAWEPPALTEVFSLRHGFQYWVLNGYPGPSATLRSLGLDAWDNAVAAFAASCPNLVELKLWHPLGIARETGRLIHTLPETLEHLVYPARGEVDPSVTQGAPYDVRELAALALRLPRLSVISAYDVPGREENPYGSPHSSAWAEALPRYARGAGLRFRHFDSVHKAINSGLTLEYDVFPPRTIREQLVALPTPTFTESEDVGADSRASNSRMGLFRPLLRIVDSVCSRLARAHPPE